MGLGCIPDVQDFPDSFPIDVTIASKFFLLIGLR